MWCYHYYHFHHKLLLLLLSSQQVLLAWMVFLVNVVKMVFPDAMVYLDLKVTQDFPVCPEDLVLTDFVDSLVKTVSLAPRAIEVNQDSQDLKDFQDKEGPQDHQVWAAFYLYLGPFWKCCWVLSGTSVYQWSLIDVKVWLEIGEVSLSG